MKKAGLDFVRLFAILLIVIAVVFFYLNVFSPKTIPYSLRLGTLRKPITILIVGTDVTFSAETKKPMPEKPGRADSILLAYIDPIKEETNILSIPRDTYVFIPGLGKHKINTANAFGGIPLIRDSVEKLTKQKIKYYVEVKPTIIEKLVDMLGGIDVYVEKDMYYVDRAQNLNINLKKGQQKLSGKNVHNYIRFRRDLRGDLTRIERQQRILKIIAGDLAKPNNILKTPTALKLVLANIKSNLPLSTLIRLINTLRMFPIANIKTTTIACEDKYVKGVGAVLIPLPDKLNETLIEYFPNQTAQ